MSLKNTLIAIFVIFVFAMIFSPSQPEEYAKWGYEEDLAPKNWSELDERYNLCKQGVNQSPINITNAINSDIKELLLQGEAKATTFINNGYNLEVKFSNGNFLSFGDKKYSLKSLTFHTPSEHHINGKSFPMEIQLFHKDAYNHTVVVSMLVEQSLEDNITLNKLLRNFPEDEEDIQEIKSQVLGYELLPLKKDYYTYNGSLTTPPCSEAVRWIVLKTPLKATKSQLDDFKAVLEKNNRPIQKTNSRFILN